MIAHYYECDGLCGSRVQIVYTGIPGEHADRLPDGWVLVFDRSHYRSYCGECWERGDVRV